MGTELETHIVDLFEVANPFPGLRSFEEHEHMLFFGREEQVDDLITKLRKNRFLAVIGTSGSGKSSLVKSGLLPSLYGGFMAQSGSNWQTVTFRPGVDPIGNMSKALCESNYNYLDELGVDDVDYSDVIESGLRRSDRGLVDFYHQNMTHRKGENLLILVDQFEELFRFSDIEKSKQDGFSDAVAFIELLLTASQQSDVPVYIVFTMRSDFLGECTRFKGLPEAINDGHYLVPRMSREQIREVIEGPVKVGGAEISRTLVNRILNDLGDNPDQLPILQHALMRVWDHWRVHSQQMGPLDNEHYEAIGQLKGALSQHAEEAYSELEEDENQTLQRLCKAIFKTLTDRGKDNRGTRRPTPVKEVMRLTNASFEEVNEVTRVFRESGRGFLLPDMEVELSETSILDISHESLMRVWVRLMTWVEEESESIQMYLRLTEAADQYEQRKGGLWRNPELSLAIKWKNDNQPNELWAQRLNDQFEHTMLFLDYSIDQQEKEERYKEEQQKSRLRRARIFATSVGSIAIIAFVAAFIAVKKEREAERAQKDLKDEKMLSIKAKNEALKDRDRAKKAAKEAKLAEKKAIENQRLAKRNGEIAIQEKKEAERQKQIALQKADEARNQEIIANNARQKAKEKQEQAETLFRAAKAESLAMASISKYNSGLRDSSKQKVLEAFRAETGNDSTKGINMSKNAILEALYLNWTVLKAEQNKIQNNNEIKHISYNKSLNRALILDDGGDLNIKAIENKSFIPFARSIALGKNNRINSVFLDDNEDILHLNSEGSLYRTIKRTKQTIHEVDLGDKIFGKSLIVRIGKHILIKNSDKIWIILEGVVTKRFTNIDAFCYSEKKDYFIWVFQNKIQGFKGIKNFGLNAEFTAEIVDPIITGSISCMSMNTNQNKVVMGTTNGNLAFFELGGILNKNVKNSVRELGEYKVHNSSITEVLWVDKLNGEESIITAGFDGKLKICSVKDYMGNLYASNTLSLPVHRSWIYGLIWLDKQRSIISYSEDKTAVLSLVESESLYKDLKNE